MSVKNAAFMSQAVRLPVNRQKKKKKKKKKVWVQDKQHCQTLRPRTASVFNYSKCEVKSLMERSGNIF